MLVEIFLILFCIDLSVFVSKEDVASSNTNIFGFFKSSLAMAILCFSPPESLRPRSPTIVWFLAHRALCAVEDFFAQVDQQSEATHGRVFAVFGVL